MVHHADDLAPLRLRRANAKQYPLPNRRLVRKSLRRECLIHDQQVPIRRAVFLRKRPSSEKPRAHRFKIPRQNDLKIRSLKLTRIGKRILFTPSHRTNPAGKRQRKRRRNALHTWNRTQLLTKLTLEVVSYLRRRADVPE